MSIEFVKFALVVEGEVISNVSLVNEPPNDRIIAAIRTGITYVEVPAEVPVGSTWDGETFIPPAP